MLKCFHTVVFVLILVFEQVPFSQLSAQSLVIGPDIEVFSSGRIILKGYINPTANNIVIKDGGSFIHLTGSILALPDTLVIDEGGNLTLLEGALVSTPGYSRIIIESDAFYLNQSSSNPYLEARRRIDGDKGWRMLGCPVSTTFADLFDSLVTQGFPGSSYPLLQPNLMWFDETDGGTSLQGWRTPSSLSGNVPTGQGYYHYIFNGAGITTGGYYSDDLPLTMTANGYENALVSGSFDFGITFTPRDPSGQSGPGTYVDLNVADEGWNLLGNPSASSLDWDSASAWTRTHVDNSFYVWDPSANSGAGDFLFWNGSEGTLGNGIIAPFQSFWVRANDEDPVLIFSNQAKTIEGAWQGKSVKDHKLSGGDLSIDLSLSASWMKTEAFIRLNDNGVIGPDPMDAYHLESLNDTWLELYTLSSPAHCMPLALNNQPSLKTSLINLPLFLGGQIKGQSLSGSGTLSWKIPDNWPTDWNISLHDHQAKKAVSMINNAQYVFGLPSKSMSSKSGTGDFPSPPDIIRSVSEIKDGKSSQLLPPFSIIIQKGDANQEVEYLPLQPFFFPIFPNPMQQSTTLRFSLPEPAKVEIDVFDIRGVLLDVALSGNFQAGITEMKWTPPSHYSGVYLFRFTCGETVTTMKGVIVRP